MSKHVLLIDDEPNIRELLGIALKGKGYRVTAASSADEAQMTVKKDPPDLIISDLQLEDEDGLAIIAQLKTTLPNVPVILLTGVLFDPQVVRENLSKKVSCYLEKTSSLSKITDTIKRLLAE
jgi:two-component system response regulator GlrR